VRSGDYVNTGGIFQRAASIQIPDKEVDKRVKGIEPSCPAWEAGVLPLNYTRGRKVEGRGMKDEAEEVKRSVKTIVDFRLSTGDSDVIDLGARGKNGHEFLTAEAIFWYPWPVWT
jgi:hypothetical protein